MFQTKEIYECFISLPKGVTEPVKFSFVRMDNNQKLQSFVVPPGGTHCWTALPGHTIFETPDNRVRIVAEPESEMLFNTLVHVDVIYTFPGDASPIYATEFWGKWMEVNDPIPIGDYIKGTVTRTLIEHNGRRYKHKNFGQQSVTAHFTQDIERLAKYLAEHNGRTC